MGREAMHSLCPSVWGLYMTYLGGDERSSQQHRGGKEKAERGVWLNGILATTQLKVCSCFFSLCERVYMHTAFIAYTQI